jgi:hypothetical protein
LIDLTKAVASLEDIKSVYFNFGFNDAKGYGLIRIM